MATHVRPRRALRYLLLTALLGSFALTLVTGSLGCGGRKPCDAPVKRLER